MRRGLLMGTLVCLAAGSVAWAQDKPAATPAEKTPEQKAEAAPVLCPVTGKPIDRTQVTRFKDRWVYFADAAAKEKFLADPLEYALEVQKQWAADVPPRMQVKCPVTGKPVKDTIYVGAGWDAVYFATDEAKAAYEKEPAKYLKRLEKECYTYQTVCVVSDSPIDLQVSRDYQGKTIYFRCAHCQGEFDKAEDKDALLKKAEAQEREHKKTWIMYLLNRKVGQSAAPAKKPEAQPAQ